MSKLLNTEELEAFDCLARYMDLVWHEWEMEANMTEATSAIHVLQHHIIQHAIQREYPDQFNNWWKK